jgi:hypothetical protein
MESTKKTYYFMVKAKRYTRLNLSTQTRFAEITVDSEKYTRRDAEHFATREFIHLDDEWMIQVSSMTRDIYQFNKNLETKLLNDVHRAANGIAWEIDPRELTNS